MENFEKLKKINFNFKEREIQLFKYMVELNPAIRIYKKNYGKNEKMSASFIIPCDNQKWPKKYQKMKLGEQIYELKNQNNLEKNMHPKLVKILRNL